jgi:phosphate transport system ATP-binding protein
MKASSVESPAPAPTTPTPLSAPVPTPDPRTDVAAVTVRSPAAGPSYLAPPGGTDRFAPGWSPRMETGAAQKVGGDRHASHLEATRVSCWFSSRKVLEDVTLSMPPRAITALIGPSGCGKSTFLRVLNRMHELIPGSALSGSVRLDGQEIYGAAATPTTVRFQIGMVFQRPNPFPAMSIADNVLAGLKLTGTKVRNTDEVLELSLRRAGLWHETRDRLGTSGASLSGGQQQRLCIARALALQPRVLLMDEPCSALDPISTRVIEETMLSIKHDVTIVIVTHNMQQAQRVSDQCALFLVDAENAPGRIVEFGPTDRVFSDPSDPRTLDYVSGRFG